MHALGGLRVRNGALRVLPAGGSNKGETVRDATGVHSPPGLPFQ